MSVVQGPRQLVSWKEIADYLGRDVRTVVRWEKDKGLPVHRVPGGKRQAVYAFSDELDRWLRGEPEAASAEPSSMPTGPILDANAAHAGKRRIRRAEWAVLIAVVLVCFSLLGFLFRPLQQPEEVLHLVRLNLQRGTAIGAVLSPDGREVAYCFRPLGESKWHVYVQLIGAGDPVRVTKGDDSEGNPAWSPDGRFLAFATYGEAAESIVTVPVLGGTPRLATRVHDSDAMYYVTWTPDGKGLVYTDRDSENDPVTTWILHLDTGQRTRFLSAPDPLTIDFRGQFSPDGKYFAVIRGGSSAFNGSLLVMPASGGELRELTSNVVPGPIAWTADSREIIFSPFDAANETRSLARVPISGGQVRPALASAVSAVNPSVALTGRGLTYMQYEEDVNIWRLDLGGKAATSKRIADALERDVDPACSPDMKQLAFLSYRAGGADLWVSDREGASLRRLTFNAGTSTGNSGTPDWSPDGNSIAFSVSRNHQTDVAVIGVNSQDVRYLTTHPAADGFPRWSRDGRFLYFTSDRTGRNEIWKMEADGSNAVQVTHNGGFVGQESPDGRYLYFGKPNANGIWRLPVAGGPEELVVPDMPRRFAWTMSDKGIYFANGNSFPGLAVHFYNFATGKTSHVFEPDRFLQYAPAKLSACRDGRTLFISQADVVRSDLIWAENFK